MNAPRSPLQRKSEVARMLSQPTKTVWPRGATPAALNGSGVHMSSIRRIGWG
jgi:hypothetical protein